MSPGSPWSRPAWAPALPPEARTLAEPDGSSGVASLLILLGVSLGAALVFAHLRYDATTATDVRVVVTLSVGMGLAFGLAVTNRVLGLKLLSQAAERVTFVLIPPLALVFLVLGTIFLGVATPTEGGAMGATGALIMALSRRRLSLSLLRQATESTAKLSAFVLFILIGARVFSLTFYGVNGHIWVEHLLSGLPGGELGFLIVVNILVFLLAFFLDFFELAFIIVPLLAPVADKLGIDLVWFGVLLAVNMQTSFMHPPFGFALFFLRSVAPARAYLDKVTGLHHGAGDHGSDLLGGHPLRGDPDPHGRPGHHLPADGHGLQGRRAQGGSEPGGDPALARAEQRRGRPDRGLRRRGARSHDQP